MQDLGTPRLTYRRLRVLLERLPRDSAYALSTLGPAATWDVNSYLLAHLIDKVSELVYVTRAVHSKKKPDKPKPVTRPGLLSGEPSNVISADDWKQKRAEWRVRERARLVELDELPENWDVQMGEVS